MVVACLPASLTSADDGGGGGGNDGSLLSFFLIWVSSSGSSSCNTSHIHINLFPNILYVHKDHFSS